MKAPRKPSHFLLTWALLAILLPACASSPQNERRRGPENAPRSSAAFEEGGNFATGDLPERESKQLKEIQALYSASNYEAALQRLTAFEKRYPKSRQMPQARNLHGLILLLTKRPALAIPQFNRSIELSPGTPFAQYVRFNLATAQFEANDLNGSGTSLRQIREESLNEETRMKARFLRGRVLERQGLHLESSRELLSASRGPGDPSLQSALQTQLDQSLQGVQDLKGLTALTEEFENSPVLDSALYRQLQLQVAAGQTEAARESLQQLGTRFPNSAKLPEARQLLGAATPSLAPSLTAGQTARPIEPVAPQAPVQGQSVGLLIPLQGKFAPYGSRALQGVQLALRIFNVDQAASPVQLVIEDAGETPEQAIKALERLYFKHHVIGVIGPMLSKGIEQVTQRGRDLGVPMITLAQQPGVSGDCLFQSGMTARLQAQTVAKYAVEKLGIKTFAIAAGKDKFGEQYSQEFWTAVESVGGKVVGYESYASGETDFRQVVDKLSGLYYTEARQDELNELAKQREALNIKKRTRKTERYFSLKPIVDYEAVFIPDEPKVVGQLLPTFSYRDVDKIRFLGINTWNSPELIERAGSAAEGAIFVDAFFPESQTGAVKYFVESYRELFKQDPGGIEALAYDAARILESTLARSSPKDRGALCSELRGVSGFNGVTGKIRFKDGQFSRELQILTVTQGRITAAKE